MSPQLLAGTIAFDRPAAVSPAAFHPRLPLHKTNRCEHVERKNSHLCGDYYFWFPSSFRPLLKGNDKWIPSLCSPSRPRDAIRIRASPRLGGRRGKTRQGKARYRTTRTRAAPNGVVLPPDDDRRHRVGPVPDARRPRVPPRRVATREAHLRRIDRTHGWAAHPRSSATATASPIDDDDDVEG